MLLILILKIDKILYKSILIYYIGYKASNTVKPLCITFNKINRFFEGNNEIESLTLLSTDENKNKQKGFGEIWYEIKNFISSNNYLDDYYEANMKIRFFSDNDLPLRKT